MSINKDYYIRLVHQLRSLPDETEWVEFKVNNENPDEIGEYISALSNSAALYEKELGYLLFGIDNKTHEILGTRFNPSKAKVGDHELENWLATLLRPGIDFRFIPVEIDGKVVVVLEIPSALSQPTAFKQTEFIRIGSYKKKLKDHPEKERNLWRVFDIRPYETEIAVPHVDAMRITELLDCGAYYTLMDLPLPRSRDGIIHDMIDHSFVKRMDDGNYAITNMGALLFAKDLNQFEHLKNKMIRVIRYRGDGRTNAIRDQFFSKGYAAGFDDLITYIMSLLPQEERIERALREEFIMFPEKAVREMVGNLMVHQDMTARGQSLMVEIFDSRLEATNPGRLLADIDRIIDTAPHARNEKMAEFLRLIHICEIRGSGFDRIEEGMCDWKIPAPKVETAENYTRTQIIWRDTLSTWTKEEKIRTCYLYTCYCYVNRIPVTNAVLRERFGVEGKNAAIISRITKDALLQGKIRLFDESASLKNRTYVPFWA